MFFDVCEALFLVPLKVHEGVPADPRQAEPPPRGVILRMFIGLSVRYRFS
jgi:hypothetical protein